MDFVLPSDKSFKNPRTAEALSVYPPSDMAMPKTSAQLFFMAAWGKGGAL